MNKASELNLVGITRYIVLLLLSVLIISCGTESTEVVIDSDEPTKATEYQRVVSLAPSITEILFALGQGNKVVGVTEYCDYPPEALEKRVIGGYATPSLEAIVRCTPDLVALLEEHQDLRGQLDKLGIPYVTVNHINIVGIKSSIAALGKTLGAEAQAKVIFDDMDRRIERIQTLTKDKPRSRVLLSVGRHGGEGVQSLFIAGPGSFFDDLISIAGGENVYEGTVPYPSISAEGAVQMDPEVIIDIVPDLPEDQKSTIAKDWNTIPEVQAVANGRVHVLGDDYVAVPGPRFILTLEQMAEVFHPDVDWDTP
jgi:iron complex transport system substrate-binding protein